MTPEMRRFVEAVRDDAAERDNPISTDEGRRRSAVQLRRAATALLTAEVGAGETTLCPACGGRGECRGSDGVRQLPCHQCRGTGEESPAPSPADRDAKLERLLYEVLAAHHQKEAAVARGADVSYGGWVQVMAKVRAAEADLFAYVRRLVEQARGETVGTAILRHRRINRLIEVRDVQLTDPDWFTNSAGVAIRFVLVPEEAEHE